LVTAKTTGTATITVTAANVEYTATCTVTVTAGIVVTGVSLNKTATSLVVGGTETLLATVAPTIATNQNVTWSSDNTSVATVSRAGVVTALSAGTSTITATTDDGSHTATCAVTVVATSIAVTGVSVSPTTLSLKPDATQKLIATITPSNATNKNVTWTSSNTSVAVVAAYGGRITAKAAGTANISVTTADGNKTATCVVTVSAAGGSGDDGKAPSTAVESQETRQLYVYHNPLVSGLLTIDNEEFKVGNAINVYSANGALVLSGYVSGRSSTTLNLSHFAQGTYIVKAGNRVAKVVKP
jgi:uncharacterized protein YjdB